MRSRLQKSNVIGLNKEVNPLVELQTGYTDEEICKSLMSELEGLSDEEWDMLGNIELMPIQQEALESLLST